MKLTAIAKEDLEAKGLCLKNKIELCTSSDAIPDNFWQLIGRKDLETGEIESFFCVDKENNNTKEFEKTRSRVEVVERKHNIYVLEQNKEKKVVDYYVPYVVQESSMHKPTITDCHVESGNHTGHYECEYEFLLTCGSAVRRIVIPYSSVNISMLEFLENIEDEVRDILHGEYGEGNHFKDIINVADDGFGTVVMFDKSGRTYNIDISQPSDFISMIVSVRQIKCNFSHR